MKKHSNREKVNFMISKEILVQFRQLIPSGERSDFVNDALEDAIIDYGRRKASEAMDKIAMESGRKFSTKDFLKTRHEELL